MVITKFQPSDDYKELRKLALLFLGEPLSVADVHIHAPGAFHRARWIAKVDTASRYSCFVLSFTSAYVKYLTCVNLTFSS
jgi:hypothetical protein